MHEGPTCVYTTCPEHKCQQIVSEAVFKEFVSSGEMARYESFALTSFVDINKTLRFCPGKNCTMVVKAPLSYPRSVRCTCGSVFCFRCGEEAHDPASCAELALWKEKCQNESETANWILANTKQCPKCKTRIEKNQGCNHMTCRQCKVRSGNMEGGGGGVIRRLDSRVSLKAEAFTASEGFGVLSF